jgi:RimJ/RimL family protein N-acetyltransferase
MIEIRRFRETDDIDDVSRVYAQSWKSAYRGIVPQDYLDSIPENRWSEKLISELSSLWVVSDGDCIIGSSTYASARDDKFAGWGEIISIYLLPSYFHKGIGAKLLWASMDELVAMGYSDFYLWVLEDNHLARRFYEKNGYNINGDVMQYVIGGKLLNEIRYVYHKNDSVDERSDI